MRDECEAKGVVLRVMPFTQKPDNLEDVATVRFIQSLCQEEGVVSIDIDAYLRDNARRNFEFHVADSHPNEECHRLHGEMVAEELLRLHRAGELPSK